MIDDALSLHRYTIVSAAEETSNPDQDPNDPEQDPEGDCDCACATSRITPIKFSSSESSNAILASVTNSLVLTDDLYVVWNPSIARPCLINHRLYILLQKFAQPKSISELDPSLFPLINRCVELGLLVSTEGLPQIGESDVLVAWLHVTNACNLRCHYCYLTKTDDAMTWDTARASVDAIIRSAELHGYQAIKLKFAGGEASLNFPLIWQIHNYASTQVKQRGMRLQSIVLSNGVGLTKEQLASLREHSIQLMISLDGMQIDHDAQRVFINGKGSFLSVSKTIDRARAIGVNLIISVTITGRTASRLAELIEWLLDRDLRFSLNFYRENDCSTQFDDLKLDEQEIITGLRKAFQVISNRIPKWSMLGAIIDKANLSASHQKPCAVGENYLVIDQQGGVAKCQMEIERTITDVYNPDPLNVIRLDSIGVQNVSVDEKEGCSVCEWKYWCAGGCPITTFRATGRYDIKSPNCNIYKSLYPDVIRLEAKRLLHFGEQETFVLGETLL